MTARLPRSSRWTRAAAAAVALGALAVHVVSGSALGGVQARIDNSSNSASAGTLLYSHSYGTATCTSVPAGAVTDAVQTTACAGSPYPPSAAAARDDAITANGNVPASAVTESVAIASCGLVQLANTVAASNPLLPRYGTTFGATGPYGGATAITLDGAGPGGYASAAASETEQGASVLGASYGVGVWFRTSSTTGGPLFSLGTSSARDTAESFDRTLYLTAAGKLAFIYRTNGASITSSNTYRDGLWHFAYARMSTSVLGTSVTLFVDGGSAASTSVLLGSLDSLTGYWHLGWAPATNGVPTQYLAGSLADFMVFNSGSAPGGPSSTPGTQAALDSFASSATGYWKLADTGTTTVATGTAVGAIGSTNACSYVDLTWGSTNPTSCAVAPTSTTAACTVTTTRLSTVANSAFRTIGSVAPGATQTLTMTLAHDTTYPATGTVAAFLPGLLIYAPVTMKFVASTKWSATFTWTSAGTGFQL